MLKNVFFIFSIFSFRYSLSKRMRIIKRNEHYVNKSCMESKFDYSKMNQLDQKNNENVVFEQVSRLSDDRKLENIREEVGQVPLPSISECAKLPVDPCLGAQEMEKIESYYQDMLSKLKCQLHEASQQRIKEFEVQMEGMANQKINCEIAAIAAKEEVIRQAMCDELERYDRALRQEECDLLQAKACQLASKIKIEVKEAVCNVPK